MARPKEFDPEQALGGALECFRQHGFAGASMETLTERMGIGRASLYDTFGDKRALYLAALERYAEATAAYVEECLDGADRPVETIGALLREVADKAVAVDGKHGCFLVNCTAELASNDAEIAAFVASSFERIEDAYHRALRRAQQEGDLDGSKDARALARFLVAQMQSLRIVGKSRGDAAVLRDVVETALECLG
jgi:TetR/AcrR family transcriptional repressor of nem operon